MDRGGSLAPDGLLGPLFFSDGVEAATVSHGTGSPEGALAANPGSIYTRRDSPDDATVLYWKTSGSGTTGWVAAASTTVTVREVTESGGLTAQDRVVLADATAGVVTLTLPLAAGNVGVVLTVKKIDVSINNVVIDGNGGETIDEGLGATITSQFESVTVCSDGTEWWIL